LNLIRIDLPPPERPPPTPKPAEQRRSHGKASPPDLRAEPTPIVAPRPEVPVPIPPPIPAAPIDGAGSANAVGNAEVPGLGTGASGQGNGQGSGSGGQGDGSGGTPPQWIRGRIKDSDYPKSAGEAGISGTVSVRYIVEVDGHATSCRVTASSGNPELDATTCQLIEKRFRFKPSRDEEGRPARATIVENHSWVIDRVPDAAEPGGHE
jgi:protein TonB